MTSPGNESFEAYLTGTPEPTLPPEVARQIKPPDFDHLFKPTGFSPSANSMVPFLQHLASVIRNWRGLSDEELEQRLAYIRLILGFLPELNRIPEETAAWTELRAAKKETLEAHGFRPAAPRPVKTLDARTATAADFEAAGFKVIRHPKPAPTAAPVPVRSARRFALARQTGRGFRRAASGRRSASGGTLAAAGGGSGDESSGSADSDPPPSATRPPLVGTLNEQERLIGIALRRFAGSLIARLGGDDELAARLENQADDDLTAAIDLFPAGLGAL